MTTRDIAKNTATLLIAVVLLSNCGGNGPSTSSPPAASSHTKAPEGGFGTYEFTEEGGVRLSVTVPIDASDPRVQEVEALRKKLGGPPLTYLIADVDNRNGAEEVVVTYVAVITDDGSTVQVDYIANGSDSVLEEDPYTGNNDAIDLSNKLLNQERVRPGARTQLIFATAEQIPTVARVSAPLQELSEEVPLRKVSG